MRRTCGRCWPGWRSGVDRAAELRALERAQGTRFWLAAEPADMRGGFDRLAERVKTVIGEDPLSGHLFVFRSRRGDWLRILVWDPDRYVPHVDGGVQGGRGENSPTLACRDINSC